MKINPFQAILVAFAILATAVLAKLLEPRQLMARSSVNLNLEQIIPEKFGGWASAPGIGLVTPNDNPDFVELDPASGRVYAKELARGYVDSHGNVVMLLIAYGPIQNHRLKAHRPEFCYAAAGFSVSSKTSGELLYEGSAFPVRLTRLITERGKRFEPVSYWLRTGNEVATGIVDQQLIRLKYGLQGIIPDGALVRISTVGMSADESFKIQDQFIRGLLEAVSPQARKFLTGRA